MNNKVIRTKVQKEPEVVLGTVTLKDTYTSCYDGTVFPKDEALKVGKVLISPTGRRSYKILGTTHWVCDNEVHSVNVNNVPTRRTVKIYSA